MGPVVAAKTPELVDGGLLVPGVTVSQESLDFKLKGILYLNMFSHVVSFIIILVNIGDGFFILLSKVKA